MANRYELTGTRLYRSGDNSNEAVERGDIIEPTEAELDSFGDLLRPVEPATETDENAEDTTSEETTSSDESDSGDEAVIAEPPFDPSQYTIQELDEEIAENDYSDDELEAALDVEQSGDDRSGAKDTIQAHLDA